MCLRFAVGGRVTHTHSPAAYREPWGRQGGGRRGDGEVRRRCRLRRGGGGPPFPRSDSFALGGGGRAPVLAGWPGGLS
eukprot:scaffold20560_cov34-Tisochrysis_lutea.AAC.1